MNKDNNLITRAAAPAAEEQKSLGELLMPKDQRNAILAKYAPPATALGDEREMFEAEERKYSSNLNRQADGQYENPCTQSAWEGWQNRAAVSAATKSAEPVIHAPREKQLEAVAHAAAMDLVRIHEALGLPADEEVDAERIIAHIARQAQPTDRDEVLEEAAAHITQGNEQVIKNGWIDCANERTRCAAAIRALKGKSGSEGAAS